MSVSMCVGRIIWVSLIFGLEVINLVWFSGKNGPIGMFFTYVRMLNLAFSMCVRRVGVCANKS